MQLKDLNSSRAVVKQAEKERESIHADFVYMQQLIGIDVAHLGFLSIDAASPQANFLIRKIKGSWIRGTDKDFIFST